MKWQLVRQSLISLAPRQSSQLLECGTVRYLSITSRLHSTAAEAIPPPQQDATISQNFTPISGQVPKLISHATLLRQPPGDEVSIRVAGNVHSKRVHKKVAFLFVGDGSTYEPIQAVLQPEIVSA